MIPKVHRSSDMVRLMRYLAGPGKANEHTDQKVIAGDAVTMAVFAGRIDSARAAELARLLDSPRQTLLRGAPVLAVSYKKARALQADGMSRDEAIEAATTVENTWHASLSLAAEEGQLDDATWAAISRDFMREMGFIDQDGVPDVRWAVVRHGLSANRNDHVHIAVGVVRPDGSTIDTFRDFSRAQAAARVLERRYELRVLHSRADRGTEIGLSQGERARADRTAAPETEREGLRRRVRAAAVAADSEAEWVRALKAEGLVVRPRYSAGGQVEVAGYSVRSPALRNTKGGWEKSIWYGGGRLARDLTLQSLRSWAGWDTSPAAQAAALEEWGRPSTTRAGRPAGRDQISEKDAIEVLGRWSAYMRTIPAGDREAWAQAASHTAGVFAAASVRSETRPGPLDKMSRQLARAGQLPAHQRRPRGVHGVGLRAVARMLWGSQSNTAATLALVYALTECLLTIRDMLAATDRAAAAAAMASHAKRALTEVHMRHAGIDPTRPYVRDVGSPPWAAAVRAAVVVDRGDRAAAEEQIRERSELWRIQRLTAAQSSHRRQVDEFGHIISEQRRRPSWSAAQRAAGPLTPPTGTARDQGYTPQTPPPYRGPGGPDHGRGRGFER